MKALFLRLVSGSVRRHLVLGVALVHAVMMAVFVSDITQRERASLHQQAVDQSLSLADILAVNSVSRVLTNDLVGLQETVDGVSAYPDIRYVMVVDPSGRVLAHSDRKVVGLYLSDSEGRRMLAASPHSLLLQSTATVSDTAAPVMASGRLVGWARVGLNLETITAAQSHIVRQGIMYALIAIAVGSLLALFIGRHLTRGLNTLEQVAEKVKAGERGLRAEVVNQDEVGRLAEDFNAMLNALEMREAELDASRAQLAQSEERFALAMAGANDGLWDWDLTAKTVFYSPRWKAMIGYTPHEIGNSPDEWRDRLHPDDAAHAQQEVEAYLRGERARFEAVFRFRHRNGDYLWILARGAASRDAQGHIVRLSGTHVDISAQKALENQIHEARERAEVTLAAIGDGVLVADHHGHITYLNAVAEHLTGWTSAKANGVNSVEIIQLVNEDNGEAVDSPIEQCRRQRSVIKGASNTLLVTNHGRRIAIEHSAAPIFNDEGRLSGVVMVFQDVSEKRAMTRDLSRQVSHDALTGLASRIAFEARIETLVADAHASGQTHALLYLDLDQFKIVNDTCGHAAGDQLLKQLSQHMHAQIRARDMFARLGGDEFGVLLEACPLSVATKIADTLVEAVREFRFAWADRQFQVGVSIGVVALDADCESASDALSAADVACYAAKDAGRSRSHVYSAGDHTSATRHMELHMAARLRSALQENRFSLFGQAIRPIGAGAMHAQAAEHHEILVRMHDEAGELVPPGAFIPAAERYGLMPEIDRWVIHNALRMVAETRTQAHVSLAINLSGLSLLDTTLPAYIREQLRLTGVDPARLCFEITETAAIAHLTTAVAFIKEMRALGCSFALDDFGSGMSSFAYLKNLPVDYLKIDGAFVKDIVDDPLDHTFVETINRIGQAMGMKTVAEFVENDAILAHLREIGVDYAQGYGIARPMPFSEICESCRPAPAMYRQA
jgi:diguanylate cyclase (GGDEF)-like protein/PAS domain S-box-containing protein